MSVIYSTTATAIGARDGKATLSDSDTTFNIVPPASNRQGNNPEQLFAIGYASCFDGALGLAKKQANASFDDEVQVSVDLNKAGDTDFNLSLKIHVVAKNTQISQDDLTKIVEQAHEICPYSKAVKGNIDIALSAEVA